jgi:hypothetical protein
MKPRIQYVVKARFQCVGKASGSGSMVMINIS